MPNTSTNVKFGKPKATGAIFCAPSGTTLPTNAMTALPASYKCLGYMSEDGLTEEITRDSEQVKAWGGDIVARPQTAYGKTYKFNCIELNDTALGVVYGEENVSTVEGVTTIKSNATELPNLVWVMELALDAETVMRKVVPIGKVSEVGEISYKDGTPVTLPVTLAAFPNEDGDYEIAYKAVVTAGSD